MNAYPYDLHIHSCLSPCGDNDMTPNNIAGMAALAGLGVAIDATTEAQRPDFLRPGREAELAVTLAALRERHLATPTSLR